MKIPNTWRKKALFIIDIQDWFVIERNKYILNNIKKILTNIEYDMIVYSLSYNKKWSLWFTQAWWFEECSDNETLPEIKKILDTKQNVFKTKKLTRSIWKADDDIKTLISNNNIEEIHICWLVSNDCVMASTFESMDNWYYTFVIEEACETRTTQENDVYAKNILNYLNLTNNSKFVWYENTNFINL